MILFDLPDSPGIYCIRNISTQRIYVGSATNIARRWREHFYQLQEGRHHNAYLQRAWRKYGPSDFVPEVLEYVLVPEMLTAREQAWFSKLRPFGRRGFNLCPTAGSALGRKHSLATRAKIAAAQTGRSNPHPGTNFKRGRIVSSETRARLSAANRGKIPHPETQRLARIASTGNDWRAKDYIVTDPNGTEYTVHSLSKFCKEHHLRTSNLSQVASGKRNHVGGWKARYADPSACLSASEIAQKRTSDERYDSQRTTIIVTFPNGNEESITGIKQFCRDHGLDPSSLIRTAKGFDHKGNACTQHKGFKARYPDPS